MSLRIEDLDEFEGLTADMVRAWLRANGFTLKQTEQWSIWVRGAEAVHDHLLAETVTLEYLASTVAQCSLQSLLREINPRMRAWWPSEEERARHRYWLAAWESRGCEAELAVGYFDEDEEDGSTVLVAGHDLWTEVDAKRLDMKFWPCDQHGNKTRRGA